MIYLILLVLEILVLFLLMRKLLPKIYRRLGIWLFSVLFLPGTFLHEISHFLTALFLLVPVGQIELMPERTESGLKMGSVPIGKTDPIRRTLIGVAPVIFGLGVLFITTPFTIPIWAHAYIAFEVGNTMFSSKKDLEGSIIVFIVLATIISILYLMGVRIDFNFDYSIIQRADLFLAIPVGIDFLLLLILR